MLGAEIIDHFFDHALHRPPVHRSPDIELALGIGWQIATQLDLAYA